MKLIASLLYFSPVLLSVMGYQMWGYPGIAAGLMPVLLIVLGVKSRKLPIVQWGKLDGANGRNWPLYVLMDERAEYPLAVLAQELYESVYKTNPITLMTSRSGKGARELELRGHEVEVQAAVRLYGVDETTYRAKEARGMTGYKQFKDWQAPEIEQAMMKHSGVAAKWVKDNGKRLRPKVGR